MSVKASTWAWEQNLKLTEKLVLLCLADHADHEGVCWPGQKSVCRKTGVHRATVTRSIGRLEDLGLLRVEPQRVAGHRGRNVYHLDLSANVAESDIGAEPQGRTQRPPMSQSANPSDIDPSMNHQGDEAEEVTEQPPKAEQLEEKDKAAQHWAKLAGRYPNILQISELGRLEKHCGTARLIEHTDALFRNGSRSMDILIRRVIEDWETDPLAKKEPDEGEAHPTVDELIKKGDL